MTEYPSDSSNSRLDEEKIEEETQAERDAERLRKLGYDSVLGRPLGFWGNMFLSLTCMNPLFDVVVSTSLWAGDAPAVFVYGYPVTILLHFIMIGPYAEFASAYPVAGAHASWAWRAARAGIRGERQWSWFTNGFVLAGHLGKLLTGLYHAVEGCTQAYISIAGVTWNLKKEDYELWWNPVFHIVLVSAITIILMTRLSRNAKFWTVVGILNILIVLVFMVVYAIGVTRTPSRRVLDFPHRNKWVKSFSYMVWMAAPTKFIPFDAAAHMSEETRNPAKNVPRSLYVTAAIHFSLVYATVCCFIFAMTPEALAVFGFTNKSNVIVLNQMLGMSIHGMTALGIIAITISCSQFLATVVICSRFIFAIARDHGLPFSKYLKMTNRHREPWVANLVLVAIAYLSLISWLYPLDDRGRYYQLSQTISYLMPHVGYFILFALYLFSNLDLEHEQRTQFTLRKWSKPCAAISCLWLLVAIIQGCFPLTNFSTMTEQAVDTSSVTTLSYFPWAFMGMVAIMTISWFLYGRRHFVGPVRAMTKWTAGVEINPEEANPNSRTNVVRAYLSGGGDKEKESNGSGPMTPLKAKSKRSSYQSDREKSTPISPTVQAPALAYTQPSSEVAQAESQLLPESAQVESQLLPTKRLSWYQRRESRQPRRRLDGIEEVAGQEMSRSNAQQESGIFPQAHTQTQMSIAQQESGIFPQATSPTQTQFSIAQQESGIFPSQTQSQFAIAQQESGIFPASTRFSVAQQESQLMPTQSRFDPEATYLSTAQEESQCLPEESQILSYPPPPTHRPMGYPAPPRRPRK